MRTFIVAFVILCIFMVENAERFGSSFQRCHNDDSGQWIRRIGSQRGECERDKESTEKPNDKITSNNIDYVDNDFVSESYRARCVCECVIVILVVFHASLNNIHSENSTIQMPHTKKKKQNEKNTATKTNNNLFDLISFCVDNVTQRRTMRFYPFDVWYNNNSRLSFHFSEWNGSRCFDYTIS